MKDTATREAMLFGNRRRSCSYGILIQMDKSAAQLAYHQSTMHDRRSSCTGGRVCA